MGFFTHDIIDQVEAVAKIRYMGRDDIKLWNENRRGGELRLLSGWMWTAKDGSGRYQQGLNTFSAAIRDAYYAMIENKAAPGDLGRRAKLRVVA